MYYRVTKAGIDFLSEGGYSGSWLVEDKSSYNVTINEAPRIYTHNGDSHGGIHLPFSDARYMSTNAPIARDTNHHPILVWLAKHWWCVLVPLLTGLALIWADKNWRVIEELLPGIR